ncbi:MAG: hypothetical protein ACI3XY_08340 [Butyricicoccaceae bacterium]
MSRRKKIICGAVLAAAALLSLFLPITSEVQPVSDVMWERMLQNDALCAAVGQSDKVGEIYLVTSKSLFGQERHTICVPYLKNLTGDVGTAGTGHWVLTCGAVSLQVESGKINKNILKQAALTVTADENTALMLSGGSEYSSSVQVPEGKMERTDQGELCAVLNVSTRDSSKPRQRDCEAEIRWNGVMKVRMGWFITEEIEFEASEDITYQNNV